MEVTELMEDEECYVCMICGSSPDLQSSVELLWETFLPTFTLERTLEMLCPKIDTKEMMEVLTRVEGSTLCCPCLAALHRGMGVVSDIIRLEEYVKNLAGSIEMAMRDSNDLRNKLEERLVDTQGLTKEFSLSKEATIRQDGFSLESKEDGELETEVERGTDSDRDTQEKTTEVEMEAPVPSTAAESRKNRKPLKRCKKRQKTTSVEAESSRLELSKEAMIRQDGLSLNSKEDVELEAQVEKSTDSNNDSQANKTELKMEPLVPCSAAESRINAKLRECNTKKQKKTSVEAESSRVKLSQKFQPFPGVQNCPLCDFSVDVRTLEEAKSPESLPKFVCDTLRKNSTFRLVLHFKKCHLPANARTNFETDSEGKKQFICVECPFKCPRFNKTVKHYLNAHVRPLAEDTSKRLPCPEGGCSFVADVSSQPGFRRASNIKRFFREAEAIAEHVIRDHDLAPVEEPCPRKVNYTTSFYVETEDNRKEYRCTRCYYYEGLAKGKDHSQSDISSCRRLLLQHFYEHHLTF